MHAIRLHRRGYTLTDLVACFAFVLFAAAMVVPISHLSFRGNNRVRCASNLRQLGLAAISYAMNERGGSFPRTRWDDQSSAITVYSGATGPRSFAPTDQPSPVADNNVTASLFLLAVAQGVQGDVFICPDSDAEKWDFIAPGKRVGDYCDFPSRKYLSYSYACPFPTTTAVQHGWRFGVNANTATGDVPLMSDMNPGAPGLLTTPPTASQQQLRPLNSPNHDGEGQNVLYFDGHVEFQRTPYCGAALGLSGPQDNIFTSGSTRSAPIGTAIAAQPQDVTDMVMLPVIGDGVQPPRQARGIARSILLAGIIGVLVLLGGGIVLMFLLMRKKQPVPAGFPGGGGAPMQPPMRAYPPPQQYPAPQQPRSVPPANRPPPPLPPDAR